MSRTIQQILQSVSIQGALDIPECVIIPQAVRLIIKPDDRPAYPNTTIIVIEVTACPDARIVRSCETDKDQVMRQLEAILTPESIAHLIQQAIDMRLADVRALSEKSLWCHKL